MADVRAGVIGVGAMGRHHARVYKQMPDVELVGVVDLDHERAERVARLHGTDAYGDYLSMLDSARPEAVTVSVPTEAHCQVALDLLDAGCHVLIEKPIAATPEEARRIIDRASAVKRVLAVGHIERFNPAVVELKRRIGAGDIGRVFQIHARRLGPFPARVRDVGVVIDLAPHDLDIMRYLTDSEVRRVYAETEQEIHTAHEDMFSGLVRFDDGVVGALDINWLTPNKIREISVTGEGGMFVANLLTQDLYFYENDMVNGLEWDSMSVLRGVSEGRMIRLKVGRREPLRAELEAFVAAVRGEPSEVVTGEDGLAALDLALKLVQSGCDGRAIECGEHQQR